MDTQYTLTTSLLQNGVPSQTQTLNGSMTDGQIWSMPLTISQTTTMNAQSTLALEPQDTGLQEGSVLGLPDGLQIVAGKKSTVFTVSEITGKAGISNIQIGPSDLWLGAEDLIPAGAITISPSNFSLPAGGSQNVTITIDPSYGGDIHSGAGFLGNVTITTDSAGSRVIPLQINLVDLKKVFLPVIIR
jgi:hypothetical protein